jgi:uncharacterized protein affecting Mg2+/Co2+ transport
VLPQEGQLPLSLHGLKQLVRDNFRAHSASTQQQQSGTSSGQQQLSPLDQGFAALRALPQQVYLESCSSSYVLNDVIIEATSCYNPKADPFASAGAITGSSSSSRDQWFLYRIRVTNNRDHCIKVLGRGWVISSALGELEGYVQLTADNGIVGQKPVIPPGACFEYYSCSSLKRATGPGTMKGQLLLSLLGPANQDDQQQQADAAAAAVDTEGSAAGAQQQETSSSSSSSRRGAAAGAEVELERVAMPVAEFKLQSPATAAAAVEAARAALNASSSSAGGSADGSQGEQQGGAAEEGSSSSSSSREAGSGSDSSSSDDEGSRR